MKKYIKENFGEGKNIESNQDMVEEYKDYDDFIEELEEVIVEGEYSDENIVIWEDKEYDSAGEYPNGMAWYNLTTILENKKIGILMMSRYSVRLEGMDFEEDIEDYEGGTMYYPLTQELKESIEEYKRLEKERNKKNMDEYKVWQEKMMREKKDEEDKKRDVKKSIIQELKRSGMKQRKSKKGNLISQYEVTMYQYKEKMYTDIEVAFEEVEKERGEVLDDYQKYCIERDGSLKAVIKVKQNGMLEEVKKRTDHKILNYVKGYVNKVNNDKGMYDEMLLWGNEEYEGKEITLLEYTEERLNRDEQKRRRRDEDFGNILKMFF